MTTTTVPQIKMSKKQYEFYYNLIRPALDRFTDVNFITAHVSDNNKVMSIKVNVTVWKGSTPIAGMFTRRYKCGGNLAKVYTADVYDYWS